MVATATVAFGTELSDTLPRRIVATHEAADVLAAPHDQMPQLQRLTDEDPFIEFELSSVFHTAYLTGHGTAEDRAKRRP